MVKTKHKKSSLPKNSNHIKKHGKEADITQFRGQLDSLGLKITHVTADGNCFFRCLADQLEGNEEEHEKYRNMVVQYIMKNREMFEPFIEDDVPFDEYCRSMEKDGSWAGHMELQAASLVTRSNICIHRHMAPRWYIRNFAQHGARMIHLSYHDGEHYNSVRSKEDPGDGPARPIIIKADADLSATSNQAKNVGNKPKKGAVKDVIDAGSIKVVMLGSGCENVDKVRQVLLQVDGDVDAAIEFLVTEQAANDYSTEDTSLSSLTDTSHGEGDGANSEQQEEESIQNSKLYADDNYSTQTSNAGSSQSDDKKIPRNKVCPCGSKKKYKACCGTVKGRPAKLIVNQTVDSKKDRIGRKQGKKGASVESFTSIDDGLHDMGALCI